MQLLIFFSLLSSGVLSKSVNIASQNTGCYRYMLDQYQCVPSADKDRCPVAGFETNKVTKFPGLGYNTTIPVKPVAGGNGICGNYDTKATLGVCLWSGSNPVDGSDPITSGWLNGGLKSNCNKFVYVQRKGKPETIRYARVLDGCSFDIRDPKKACGQIWMTTALFNEFEPSEDDLKKGNIQDSFTWGFDNEFAQHPFNAPV